MPDVGLFTATEPFPHDCKVVIRYSVEVGGLPVYSETYDVETIAKELEANEEKAVALWARRTSVPSPLGTGRASARR